MTLEVFRWVCLASVLSTLIPLIPLVIYWRLQPKQNLILGLSLCLSFTFDIIGWTLGFYFGKSSWVANNLYCILCLPAIMWFYYVTMSKRTLKIVICIFTFTFLTLALILALREGLQVPNYFTMTLSSILITTTSFFFVGDLKLMDTSHFAKHQFHQTNILINTSLAFYYFITIILFAFTDYIFATTSPDDGRLFWSFHNAMHVLKNVGITLAFYLTAKASITFANTQNSRLQYP